MAIDMETATIFVAAFKNHMPAGALLLVSDIPMLPEGVKTAESDLEVTENFVEPHLRIGIDSMKQLINKSLTVKHLKFKKRLEIEKERNKKDRFDNIPLCRTGLDHE